MKRTLRVFFMAVLALTLASAAWATTSVTFQVNMSQQQTVGNFTPGTTDVVVRGPFNGWSGNANMLSAQGGGIYAGTFDIDETMFGNLEYKFVVIGNSWGDMWEWSDNRFALISGGSLVLPVVWFANVEPPSGYVDVEVMFCCDMTAQIQSGAFVPATDWVIVRGGHPNIGNWDGATQLFPQIGNPNVYELLVQFTGLALNTAIEFKYLYVEDGGAGAWNWESSGNRSFNPTGSDPDFLPPPSGNGFQEIYPGCPYFADITPGSFTTHPINLVFQVNMSSIWKRFLAEGPFTVNSLLIDNINSFQVAGYLNNWPWGNFPPEYFLHNDGLNGDVTSTDNIWSGTIVYPSGSPLTLIYKYGCIQLDAEAGFAENHSVVLDNSFSTIVLPVDCFGSQGGFYTGYPCQDQQLSVELSSFTATAGDNSVTLNWSTASESHNASFEIVRNGSFLESVPAAGAAHDYQWVDNRATNGTVYNYTLVSVDVNGVREELRTASATPSMNAGNVTEYALRGNYPNPFNPTTDIVLDVKESGNVSLKVYNMLGQEVAALVNGSMNAGHHTVRFDATNLPSGLYICKMEANGFVSQSKMMLMK